MADLSRRNLLAGLGIAPLTGFITLREEGREYRVLRAVVDVDEKLVRLLGGDGEQLRQYLRSELEAYVEAMAQAVEAEQ